MKPMQATALFTSPPTRKHSSKRQTVQVVSWVKPAIRAELSRMAEQAGLSISRLSATLLEEAIRQKLHIQHAVLLQPIIEQTISKHLRSRDNRLAFLLARGAFESGMTKALAVFLLKQAGVDQNRLKAMLDECSRKARTSLLRKTPQLETVLSEVAAWLEENDDARSWQFSK